jgi:hypothetical protein
MLKKILDTMLYSNDMAFLQYVSSNGFLSYPSHRMLSGSPYKGKRTPFTPHGSSGEPPVSVGDCRIYCSLQMCICILYLTDVFLSDY